MSEAEVLDQSIEAFVVRDSSSGRETGKTDTTTREARAPCTARSRRRRASSRRSRSDRTVRVALKTGGSYTFSYAPLDTILREVRPALAAQRPRDHADLRRRAPRSRCSSTRAAARSSPRSRCRARGLRGRSTAQRSPTRAATRSRRCSGSPRRRTTTATPPRQRGAAAGAREARREAFRGCWQGSEEDHAEAGRSDPRRAEAARGERDADRRGLPSRC
jgi:hypothetical protein